MTAPHRPPLTHRTRGSIAAVLLTVLALVAAGCGSSGDKSADPDYWVAHTTNIGDLYMSTTTNADQIAGYWSSLEGDFSHFTGVRNSDGTWTANAYTGVTLTLNKKSMVATGQIGTLHFIPVSASTWAKVGGPGKDGNATTSGKPLGPGENNSGDTSSDSKAAADGEALVVGNNKGATKVVVYEDFLSPYCREFEASTRDFLHADADKGKVLVEYRPFHLLQDNYSTLALTAWAAVLKDGTGRQALRFHDLLYDNQPYEAAADKPGIDDLVDLAKKAGVTDSAVLDAMREKDQEFIDTADAAATKAGVKGIPTIFVDGKEQQGSSVTDLADNLKQLLAKG